MISKNSFLIFNNVLRELYQCQTYGELGQTFLPMLKNAHSLPLCQHHAQPGGGAPIRLVDPLCTPCRVCRSRTQLYALCR